MGLIEKDEYMVDVPLEIGYDSKTFLASKAQGACSIDTRPVLLFSYSSENLKEMQQPDFVATMTLLTAWGTTPPDAEPLLIRGLK